jgi:recombination protein RecA
MSEALRKFQSTINQNNKTAVLCINQTRSKVGIVFGSPESIPGGRSLPFYASYRLAIRKVGKIVEKYDMWDGETMVKAKRTVGQKFRAELHKSKLSAPDQERYFVWDMEHGCIDEIGYLIAMGLELGLIKFTQKGKGARTWTVKGTTKTFRGEAALRGYLEGAPKIRLKIKSAVLDGDSQADSSKAG